MPNDSYCFSSKDKINFKFKEEPKDITVGFLEHFDIW